MRLLSTALITMATLAGLSTNLPAQTEPPANPAAPTAAESKLNEQEQAFVSLLKNAALVGRFSVEGRDDKSPAPEKYTILSATKLSGDSWIVTARVTYGKYDIPVPVPVTVKWAGDTAMIQVTDLSIPGLGSGFTSRVLFYGDRYAGTWQHGRAGGHMWGFIKPQEATEPQPAAPDPSR